MLQVYDPRKPFFTLRGILITIFIAFLLLIFMFYFLFTHRPKPAIQPVPAAPNAATTQKSDSSYYDGRGNLYNSRGQLVKPMSHNVCQGDVPLEGDYKCE